MSLTIVMYHYVRPLAQSRYPEVKGLEASRFCEQVDYLASRYTPVTVEQVIGHYRAGEALPENSVLLTFDDGYRDHFDYVFPVLQKKKIQGAFYIPRRVLLERDILDVNKIHFILAAQPDKGELVRHIDRVVEETPGLQPLENYRRDYYAANRWDGAEVIYVKRMLQHALPEALRQRLVGDLFRRYVTADTAAFAEELYVNTQDAKAMIEGGMHIGSHGSRHVWLNRMSEEEQRQDIMNSFPMLAALGIPQQGFTFCYPYGGYNADTVRLLEELGCSIAFTVEARVCGNSEAPLLLPRLDTNDIPA